MGSNHFYFQKTYVTSTCWEEETNCVINDPIVGRKVESKLAYFYFVYVLSRHVAYELAYFLAHLSTCIKSYLKIKLLNMQLTIIIYLL